MLGRVHPRIISRNKAELYTDATEKDMFVFRLHFRCVGWGEIGLDYHYDNSPRDIQKSIFISQLWNAVKLEKPITIHTREAEER
jgi:TatD DNase family protein